MTTMESAVLTSFVPFAVPSTTFEEVVLKVMPAGGVTFISALAPSAALLRTTTFAFGSAAALRVLLPEVRSESMVAVVAVITTLLTITVPV
jgi:hypothetical protein